uniref:Single domain-containing protein n=1 Tax=Amblyomma cajennense TaxID=34607 RepID=A0A023FEW3_AMBCJ
MRHLVLVFLLAVLGALEGSRQYSVLRDQSLHSQDGTIWFRGYNVTNRIQLMEKPCERWMSKMTKDNRPQVRVKGCVVRNVSARYIDEIEQDDKKAFPKCCPKF